MTDLKTAALPATRKRSTEVGPDMRGTLAQVLRQMDDPAVQRVEFATGNGAPEIVAYKL